MPHNNEELREEFRKEFGIEIGEHMVFTWNTNIENWWISKFTEREQAVIATVLKEIDWFYKTPTDNEWSEVKREALKNNILLALKQ